MLQHLCLSIRTWPALSQTCGLIRPKIPNSALLNTSTVEILLYQVLCQLQSSVINYCLSFYCREVETRSSSKTQVFERCHDRRRLRDVDDNEEEDTQTDRQTDTQTDTRNQWWHHRFSFGGYSPVGLENRSPQLRPGAKPR